MGTKIQANGFLREYHSVIDLDGSPSDGISPACHGNGYFQSNMEKVRQTILDQESIFRSQLQELHRLYRRQKELINEMKIREMKPQSKFLFRPAFSQDAERIRNAPYSMAGCSSALGSGSKPLPTFLEGKVVQNFPERRILSNCEPWMCKSSVCLNGTPYSLRIQADACSGSVKKRFCSTGRDTKLYLGAVQTSQCNADSLTLDLYSKRHDTAGDACITGQRGKPADLGPMFNLATTDFFQSRIHCPSDDFAEKMRYSAGEFCSGKSPAFPQNQRKELSQRTRKLFGVEIDGHDNPLDVTSKPSVVTSCSSYWIDKSFAGNLDLGGSKTESLKDVNGSWLQRCSVFGLSLDKVSTEFAETGKCLAISHEEVSKKDQRRADCHEEQENLKGSLPWFLRNSQDSCDSNKGATSCYFMNLDSLQNCSQNFFRKTETPDGPSQQGNERSTSATKILGFPISTLASFENRVPSCPDENKDVVLEKGTKKNSYISGLRQHIDLNLSMDEEASPSVPSTIVKIATTEIDLEAPAAIESDTDTLGHEEPDIIAAEALLAISLHGYSENDCNIGCLNWFAEIISSQRRGVEEESIPEGMDSFEYMTLKLEETKEEQHHYFELMDDETGNANAALTKRSRRGRRKDFQRDILPGMITLSRLEVMEDFQAFDELMKGDGGGGGRSSARNGKGRKRAGGVTVQQANCQMEDRSLTGWGKRTRRLPRQRCHNAFISFPVKC